MKKILLLLILTTNQVFAQFNISSFSTPIQQLVQEAVSDGVYIIKQSYQLKENSSGRLYGIDGKDEFGTSYSLGLKAINGFYIYDNAARPWEYDNNYKQLEKGKYSPVIATTAVCKIGKGNKFELVETDTIISLNNDVVWRMDVEMSDSAGYSILKTKGTLKGWVVLATVEKESDLAEKQEVIYSIYSREVTIGDDDKTIPFDADLESNEVVGGLFVVPENTGIGQMTFRLAGLVIHEDKEWQIAMINETDPIIAEPSSTSSSVGNESKLTPVSEDNKNGSKDKPTKKKSRKNK